MPGLVPGIHVFLPFSGDEDVDGRDEPGHCGGTTTHSIFRASSGSMIGMPSRIG
jgi:hypothetical protein